MRYHCKADNLGFKVNTKMFPTIVYSLVIYTNNLMSHIHNLKCFLEIMFLVCFFFKVHLKFEIDTSIIHGLKADFLSFNLVTKKHRFFVSNVSNQKLSDSYYSDIVVQIAIFF